MERPRLESLCTDTPPWMTSSRMSTGVEGYSGASPDAGVEAEGGGGGGGEEGENGEEGGGRGGGRGRMERMGRRKGRRGGGEEGRRGRSHSLVIPASEHS